jgi:hypothetical protein
MINDIDGIDAVNCCICGQPSELLYSDTQDYIFGVEGKWNYVKCVNSLCSTIQLNPIPKGDVIKTFYGVRFFQPNILYYTLITPRNIHTQ